MPIPTTAHIARPATASSPLTGFLAVGAELLADQDPELHGAVYAEHVGQEATLSLAADTGVVDPSVLACMAGVTRPAGHLASAESGAIERLAADRARTVFGAGYANVLPGSTGAALTGVLTALDVAGTEVLDLRGTSGADPVAEDVLSGPGQARVGEIAGLTERRRPSVLVCGGDHAPAELDYAALRSVADTAGAVLVADIGAVAGAVAVGAVENPVPHAHVTIADTHRQLFGPRGAVVLTAVRDERAAAIDGTLTWCWPGAGTLAAVAGKARALHLTMSEPFRGTVERIGAIAGALTDALVKNGSSVRRTAFAGHTVLVDLPERFGDAAPVLTALRQVGVVATEAPPGLVETSAALVLGTATLAQRQCGTCEVQQVAEVIAAVVESARPEGTVDEFVRLSAADSVRRLLSQFPLPCYVPVSQWKDRR